MTNELKIKISADLDDLKKGLNQADDAVDKFSTTAGKSANTASAAIEKVSASTSNLTNATSLSKDQIEAWDAAARRNSMEQYGNDVKRTVKEVKSLEIAQKSLQNSSAGLNKGIRANNAVAIEFSRIIQDAPYGIIGVGNNITQLTQNFANLRQQTGSTSQALKVAFSSLLSGTNLLVLGISAVTTAFTVYSMWARNNKKDTEELKDAVDEYIKSLSNLEQAQLQVRKNIEKETTDLDALWKIYTDVNESTENRVTAIKRIMEQNPKYFGDLKDEELFTSNVASAYHRLRGSIIAAAKARAYGDRLGDVTSQLIDEEAFIENLEKQIAGLGKKISDATRRTLAGIASGDLPGQAVFSIPDAELEAQHEIVQLEKELKQRKLERFKLSQQQLLLEGKINETTRDRLQYFKTESQEEADNNKKKAESSDKLAEQLIKNDNRVQVAIRTGRDKELEEARIRYEELYKAAKNNSEAIIQIAQQEADEIAAINRKYDEKSMSEALKIEQWRWNAILKAVDKGAKDKEKVEEAARKKREKAEKELAKRIYEENLYYSQQIGNAVGNALEDALGRGENFFKALRDEFKRTLIRMAADAAAAQIGKAIMSGINLSGGKSGGGFWGFLGGALGWAGKLFGGSGYSSGSFPTGNYGGGNFPATNPIKGGGFVPGVMASSKPLNINVTGVMRGQDIMMTNNRANKFNDRFNGGQ